jgi:hypothetical protein
LRWEDQVPSVFAGKDTEAPKIWLINPRLQSKSKVMLAPEPRFSTYGPEFLSLRHISLCGKK